MSEEQGQQYAVQILVSPDSAEKAKALLADGTGWELLPCIVLRKPLEQTRMDLGGGPIGVTQGQLGALLKGAKKWVA